MSYRIQVHVVGDDPVILDVDDLPKTDDTCVIGTNPQRRDGKEVAYVLREVNQIMIPIWRVNFIQVLPSEQADEVPTFVRE
jgi:hypothetical protein